MSILGANGKRGNPGACLKVTAVRAGKKGEKLCHPERLPLDPNVYDAGGQEAVATDQDGAGAGC